MYEQITIDGPAGAGKSTISLALAKKLGYLYLDTGAMYRAVAFATKRQGIDPNDNKKIEKLCSSLTLHFKTDEEPPRLFLDDEDISLAIRSQEMDMLSSTISAIKEVREAMVYLQRKIAEDKNVVAEGRDMGTVVFSGARHKFFLTASPEVRAERRYRERVRRGGESASFSQVDSELRKRDHQDKTRTWAPLKPAKDAKTIDSTRLAPEEVIEEILRYL